MPTGTYLGKDGIDCSPKPWERVGSHGHGVGLLAGLTSLSCMLEAIPPLFLITLRFFQVETRGIRTVF